MNSNDKDFFAGKRILITGAGGFVGFNIIQSLKETECEIIGLSRTHIDATNGDFEGKAKIEFRKKDITDDDPWTDLVDGVAIIYHLAAQTSIHQAKSNPVEDLRINVLPILKLLEACRKKQISPVLIQAGTVTQAGLSKYLPVDESHRDEPLTIYDIDKLTAERYLTHYIDNGYVRGATLRLANVYGPGPKSSRKDRGILNQMIARALRGETLTIFGEGNYFRDYIYIDDVVDAFLAAAVNAQKLSGSSFVLGSGKGVTIKAAFEMIARLVEIRRNIKVNVSHIPEPEDLAAIEKRNFYADISKISRDTSWHPRVELETGIDLTIDWYLSNFAITVSAQ